MGFPFNWFPQRVGTHEDQRGVLLRPQSRFPFNWFPQRVGTLMADFERYKYETEFPFNWFPQRVGTDSYRGACKLDVLRFPFNWFPQRVGTTLIGAGAGFFFGVSIQLVSPASGDVDRYDRSSSMRVANVVSIQLVSPASGDLKQTILMQSGRLVSIQLVSPASWDKVIRVPGELVDVVFPFNWFPQRVGTT